MITTKQKFIIDTPKVIGKEAKHTFRVTFLNHKGRLPKREKIKNYRKTRKQATKWQQYDITYK
jgi:hypothetical protein